MLKRVLLLNSFVQSLLVIPLVTLPCFFFCVINGHNVEVHIHLKSFKNQASINQMFNIIVNKDSY